MTLGSKRSSTSSTLLKHFLLFIGLTLIGIDAHHYCSPKRPTHDYLTSLLFATTSSLLNCSSDRHRCRPDKLQKQHHRKTVCNAKSMLRIGNRSLLQTTGKHNTSARRTSLTLSSKSLLVVMSSRKRPMSAASFIAGPGSSTPHAAPIGRMKMTRTLKQQADDNEEEPLRIEANQQYRPLVIVLAGPTAVGKSDVAAELCSPAMSSDISQGHLDSSSFWNGHSSNNGDKIKSSTPPPAGAVASRGHVVSADSVQAYRGVDIGANKPTPAEMERTPHHLVDVVDPPTDPSRAASYNAADWMKDARYVIRKLTSHKENEFDGGDGSGEEGDGEGVVTNRDASTRRESIDKALGQSLGAFGDDNETSAHGRPSILPVVVGGTMMYLQWLVHGRPDAIRPTAEAVERAVNKINGFRREVDQDTMVRESNTPLVESSDNGDIISEDDASSDKAAWNVASAHVSSLGPVFARRVDKLPGRDWYRLRRLLEVAYTIASKNKAAAKTEEGAGGGANKKSEEEILQHLTEKEVYTGIRSGSLPDLGYDVRCFFLCPDERMTHFHTVDRRCEQMLLRGLLRETAALHASGGLPEASQLTRAIGYRQALEYLTRANARRHDSDALAAFVDVFATATRQYAKKQMQWFRRDASFAFVPVRMEWDKPRRVANSAEIISQMCKLSNADFEAELSPIGKDATGESGAGCDNEISLSGRTKLENERQGKNMKFFVSKRDRLVLGSEEFLSILAEADECTKKVQCLGDDF